LDIASFQVDPDVVYLETDTSSLYLEEAQEIGRYGVGDGEQDDCGVVWAGCECCGG
jgi:hypothetical protein